MAKHVQKPPVTMAKYVRKPTDREGTSFAELLCCGHRETHRREAAVSCSLDYIERVCLY